MLKIYWIALSLNLNKNPKFFLGSFLMLHNNKIQTHHSRNWPLLPLNLLVFNSPLCWRSPRSQNAGPLLHEVFP